MERNQADENTPIKGYNFKYPLEKNNNNSSEYFIEIFLFKEKINIQIIHIFGNNIFNYESAFNFDSFVKIDEYFKFCKDINKIYDFILDLKNKNLISLNKTNENLFLCLHISQPIENIINIPLNKSLINNKSISLLLSLKNSEIMKLKEEINNKNDIVHSRLMKRNIKGYSQNLIFIEKEIEKQLKKM